MIKLKILFQKGETYVIEYKSFYYALTINSKFGNYLEKINLESWLHFSPYALEYTQTDEKEHERVIKAFEGYLKTA